MSLLLNARSANQQHLEPCQKGKLSDPTQADWSGICISDKISKQSVGVLKFKKHGLGLRL